jgi:hypothetical protein
VSAERKNKTCDGCECRKPDVKRRFNGELLCDHCASDIDADTVEIVDESFDPDRPRG